MAETSATCQLYTVPLLIQSSLRLASKRQRLTDD